MDRLPNFGSAFGANIVRQILKILDATADGLWVCDATPRLMWINDACEKLNNIKRNEVCGKTVSELLGRGNFDRDVTTRVLKEKQTVAISQKVRSGRTLLVTGVPVFDGDGEIAYVVGNERDLTELFTLRTELEEKEQLTSRLSSELRALNMRVAGTQDIVAESEAMNRVLQTSLKVAGFDTTVLVTGETGVGKSMIARLIHDGSQRAGKTFLSINCGAVPTALIEAELFGYAPGAFTDADRAGKIGLLEAAKGGTLFLDEIDAFSAAAQVKLLTFLDTQSFIRVGETRIRQSDARIIAATNGDLANLVARGQFREDLYFRLNVVPIAVPALSARRIDIPQLIRVHINKLQDRYGVARTVSPQAIEILCRYEFTGNVRELENILERAFVLCAGDEIAVTDLPTEARSQFSQLDAPEPGDLRQALDAVEAEMLARSAARNHRQQDIALELGISQPTVARLLRKHALRLSKSHSDLN